MKTKDENKPVIVYSGSFMEAQLLRTYLESAGIQAFVQDEMSGILLPLSDSAGGIGRVKVIVAKRDEAEARRLVREFLDRPQE